MHVVSEHIVFGGRQLVVSHPSIMNRSYMQVALFIPKRVKASAPVLFYLSGLTCTWENVMTKGGVQRLADQFGIIFVAPDTSPRGKDIADDSSYDLGQGASFYVNATNEPWAKNYQMADYVAKELPGLVKSITPADCNRVGITGHSMGGHGALTLAIKNPKIFKSVSAFSPICAPMQCPWGKKAFAAYFGDDQSTWRQHDTCALIEDRASDHEILIDQGMKDNFLKEQLMPHKLQQACQSHKIPLKLNLRQGYDHSYYFISSFMQDHMCWHADRLG